MSWVYLASPYSHADPKVREHRFQEACKAAAALIERGEVVFSPIAHSHSVEIVGALRKATHDLWMRQDRPFLRCSSRVVVLCLPGWKESKGVTEEIQMAHTVGIPVEYLSPDD